MREIANRYINDLQKPAAKPPTFRQIRAALAKFRCVSMFGVISVILYTLLYLFNGELTVIAQAAHSGDKTLFFIPIVIALIFSVAHGNFTSHFWDVLGVKAKTATK